MSKLVVVKGGGDLATGVAHRLFCSGFSLIVTELPCPTVVRRTVAFAQAVFSGSCAVEGVTAVKTNISDAEKVIAASKIPVIIDEAGECIKQYRPWAAVDAIIAKRNTGTYMNDAELVIALGPGFIAGVDVHAVIETMRGHELGRVIIDGTAIPDTGIPGEIGGHTAERLLRSPCEGVFQEVCSIGDTVSSGQIVGHVSGQPVRTGISGVLRGLINNGSKVHYKMKIGDVDPRCIKAQCYIISDKARAVGGGVLEALLWLGKGLRT